jgi:glutaredoxin-like protein
MPLLSAADQATLRDSLSAMTRPVRLLFFTQSIGCETCLQTRQILDELPQLSDRIAIDEANVVLDGERAARYGVERAPAVVVLYEDHGALLDSRIRFLGAPSGYEFVSLIEAVRLAGGGPPRLSAPSLARLAEVTAPTTIRVFSTPTCPHCPRAVTLANEMAFASPHITSFAVEATEFPDLSRKYQVTGVPKTVVNDRIEILGALPEDAFLEQALGGPDAPAGGGTAIIG